MEGDRAKEITTDKAEIEAKYSVHDRKATVNCGKVHRRKKEGILKGAFFETEHDGNFTASEFHLVKLIGSGKSSKVVHVRRRAEHSDRRKTPPHMEYALKVVEKDTLSTEKQVLHLQAERNILRRIRHPFCVSYVGGFETQEKLHFIFDHCPGGELFQKLKQHRFFIEEWAQIYTAEVILAIEYLHSLDILYRDLKPENVVLDCDGHARLVDFGLSKEHCSEQLIARSFVGTPEYMAPEMVQQTGHGRALDWWTVGILLYEMLTGLPPFYAKDKDTMYEKILRSEVKFPHGFSEQVQDLLNKLLVKDPSTRLGVGPGGAEEIKAHAFFRSLDWDRLLSKQVEAPLAAEVEVVGLNDFDFLATVGEGSFGKVMLVRKKRSGQIYAMKAMRTDNSVRKTQVQHAHTERFILQRCLHPFVVRLWHEFQTENNIVLILDYCGGGSLRHHLRVAKCFSLAVAAHWLGQVVLAMEHLHASNILYRDLKPDNLLLNRQGHAILVDFGLSKECVGDSKTATFCGTPEYLAPEVVKGRRYGKAVDWWGTGILFFELLCGLPPFEAQELSVLCDKILQAPLVYSNDIPTEVQHFISSLLHRDPSQRLGSRGGKEVRNHPFACGINWVALLENQIPSPYGEPMVVVPRLEATDWEKLMLQGGDIMLGQQQAAQFDSPAEQLAIAKAIGKMIGGDVAYEEQCGHESGTSATASSACDLYMVPDISPEDRETPAESLIIARQEAAAAQRQCAQIRAQLGHMLSAICNEPLGVSGIDTTVKQLTAGVLAEVLSSLMNGLDTNGGCEKQIHNSCSNNFEPVEVHRQLQKDTTSNVIKKTYTEGTHVLGIRILARLQNRMNAQRMLCVVHRWQKTAQQHLCVKRLFSTKDIQLLSQALVVANDVDASAEYDAHCKTLAQAVLVTCACILP